MFGPNETCDDIKRVVSVNTAGPSRLANANAKVADSSHVYTESSRSSANDGIQSFCDVSSAEVLFPLMPKLVSDSDVRSLGFDSSVQ